MQFSNYSAEKSITTPPRCWCSVEYFSCSSSSACQTSLSLSPAAGSVRTVYYLHLDMFCYTQNSMQYTLPFQFPSISVFKDILTCDASNIPAYPWLSKLIIQELNTGRYSPQIKINSPEIFEDIDLGFRPNKTFLHVSSCKTCTNPQPCSRKPQPSHLDPKVKQSFACLQVYCYTTVQFQRPKQKFNTNLKMILLSNSQLTVLSL